MNECAFEILAPRRHSTLVFLGKLCKSTLRSRESPISQSVRFAALVASLFILAVLSVSAFITLVLNQHFHVSAHHMVLSLERAVLPDHGYWFPSYSVISVFWLHRS